MKYEISPVLSGKRTLPNKCSIQARQCWDIARSNAPSEQCPKVPKTTDRYTLGPGIWSRCRKLSPEESLHWSSPTIWPAMLCHWTASNIVAKDLQNVLQHHCHLTTGKEEHMGFRPPPTSNMAKCNDVLRMLI